MVKYNDLIGMQFLNGGRDPLAGLDCWGLVMEIYRRFGIELPDFTIDAFEYAQIHKLAEGEANTNSWAEVRTPCIDDAPLVALMRMHPVLVTHAGVYLGHNKIIHTTKGTNAIISRASALKSRIIGYYRYVQDN